MYKLQDTRMRCGADATPASRTISTLPSHSRAMSGSSRTMRGHHPAHGRQDRCRAKAYEQAMLAERRSATEMNREPALNGPNEVEHSIRQDPSIELATTCALRDAISPASQAAMSTSRALARGGVRPAATRLSDFVRTHEQPDIATVRLTQQCADPICPRTPGCSCSNRTERSVHQRKYGRLLDRATIRQCR